MTTGHDLRKRKADELLASERVIRKIGNTRINLPQRLPLIKEVFSKKWRRQMPLGSVVTKLLTDPGDDYAWLSYILKDATGRRYSMSLKLKHSQERIVTWREFQNGSGKSRRPA
jgi:hypothetical protein